MTTQIRTAIAALAATFAVAAGAAPAAQAVALPTGGIPHITQSGTDPVNDIKIGNRSQFSQVNKTVTTQITGRPQTLVFKIGRFTTSR